jgi:hypothetical protein
MAAGADTEPRAIGRETLATQGVTGILDDGETEPGRRQGTGIAQTCPLRCTGTTVFGRSPATLAHERGAELIGAHQSGTGIDVGEDDLGAAEARGVGGRDKGQRGHDDRVAWAEAESGVGEMQGGGAVGADDGVCGPDRLRERRLEALDHRPARERRRAKDGVTAAMSSSSP